MADGTGLIKRFYTEVIGDGNLALIDELVSDDFVDHDPLPGQSPAKDGVGYFVNTMRAAFPDLKATPNQPINCKYAGYFKDTWKVKDSLTLNLGVRYEIRTHSCPSRRNR